MNEAYKKFDLSGKTAFITGGGTGLGYFMARGLARSGAKVMIAARRENVLKEAAAKLTQEAAGNTVLYTKLDLADRNNVAAVAQHAISTLGGVDIFIGNAAIEKNAKLEDLDHTAIDTMFQVNVTANMILTKLFLPHMRAKKWGRVMFSSSTMALRATAQEGMATYATCKSALNGFTRVAASEVGHDGITVNSLNLGTFYTEMWQTEILDVLDKTYGPGTSDAFSKQFVANTALGRMGETAEVEGLVQLLASDAGSYITGADLCIDGGLAIMLKPNFPAG
jgi:NAD(P)-dependent dehydrogenase (short-subunit alcohol dehydrogenase family)